ncbi:putative paf acetylhydrolase family protein [Botrytis fragariae]|uniref:Putative paf acetylhydrolase family protein n=1 Tax=Botrytis fragariae TaxID=1964551 RepID=A0A8H6B2Z3_9HELO|nr:putative paf acetylhydrolase family protein [Botrytis fragariae]KAF5878062.1 putative paf acetylhydrolase family protein [Botrytis fragariae]
MALLTLCAAFFLFFVPSLVVGQASLNSTAIPLPVPEGPYYEPYLREDCANIGEINYMPAAVVEWFNENDLPSPDLTSFSQLRFSDICLEAPTTKPDTLLLIWTGGFYTSRLHAYAGGASTYATSAYLQSIRVKDIEFVTGVFSETSEVIGLYGHSLGASSQTAVLQADTTGKYVAGYNLDGKLQPPVKPTGLDQKIYMFFAHDNHIIGSDPSWTAFWNTADVLTPNDDRVSPELPKTIHNSFTDLPFIIDVAGVRSVNESYFETLIDTIYGPRDIHDITSYVREFFDGTLKGVETHPFLDASNSSLPDVLFVRKAGY